MVSYSDCNLLEHYNLHIVLSICREFLSNRRQGVVVYGATSEWIPIVSGVPLGSVLGPPLFIQYASEMFELV